MGYLLLFLGIFILFIIFVFLFNSLDRKKIQQNGKETEAEIISIIKYYDPDKYDDIFIIYNVEGVYYEAKVSTSSLSLYKGSINTGDKIKIRYQLDNPGNYRLEERI